ncbi:hypothetical protein OPT61_g4915 [Boeremia exigua]|uniref:Uncharacterized protein n=1 Tax=Boeremia exigua TaxID=749465 RepID=A0ACC2ICF2_9PLEO|nr:hypothetical protein OPT61_g4915 [Boeremia exigua]
MTSSATPKMFQTMSPDPTSSSPPAPQASPLPPAVDIEHSTARPSSTTSQNEPSASKVKPLRKPLLRLELRDLSSDGSREFLRLVHASSAIESAVDTVLRLLYTDIEKSCIPPTRSITLVLRDMDGVAYTTGLDLDDDHKEIHLSTKYIEYVSESRRKDEIHGVIVHEMVHCWQHHGGNTAPGGLTEGVADWVRLKAGFAPPHWRRRGDCDWDAGYERTAYFLEWLEKEHGHDVVRKINQALRGCRYDAKKLWHSCCGQSIEELWDGYKQSLECGEDDSQKSGNAAMKEDTHEGHEAAATWLYQSASAYRKLTSTRIGQLGSPAQQPGAPGAVHIELQVDAIITIARTASYVTSEAERLSYSILHSPTERPETLIDLGEVPPDWTESGEYETARQYRKTGEYARATAAASRKKVTNSAGPYLDNHDSYGQATKTKRKLLHSPTWGSNPQP